MTLLASGGSCTVREPTHERIFMMLVTPGHGLSVNESSLTPVLDPLFVIGV